MVAKGRSKFAAVSSLILKFCTVYGYACGTSCFVCVCAGGMCGGQCVSACVYVVCVCVSASACHLLLLSVSNPESCCPALPSPFYGSEYAKVMFFFLSISQSLRNGNFFLQITP